MPQDPLKQKYREGIVFPLNPRGKKRSSARGGKQLLAASIKDYDTDGTKTRAIFNERSWRQNYASYYVENVTLSLKSSQAAYNISKAGLDAAYSMFEFIRGDHCYKLRDLVLRDEVFDKLVEKDLLTSFVVQGKTDEGDARNPRVEIPYGGQILTGMKMMKQVDNWKTRGTISPDTAEALQEVYANPLKYLDVESATNELRNTIVVCFGASSEMGPFHSLLLLGATVVAVDLPNRPDIWSKLVRFARASPGVLIAPQRTGDINAVEMKEVDLSYLGADLLLETPEIMHWLLTDPCFKGKKLVLGSYTYLDSVFFPKISIACDMIGWYLQVKKANSKETVVIATLSSGADVFVVPDEAVERAEERIALLSNRVVHGAVNAVSFGKLLQPNHHLRVVADNGDVFFVCDGLATIQGPNYALAKRLQHWRAVVASCDGFQVSSNIAPATFTNSVEHNPMMLYISRAISQFAPIEVFDKDTTKYLMTYLLLRDLARSDQQRELRNPLEVVSTTAVDCGVWRSAIKIGTAGEVAMLMFFVGATLEKLGLSTFLQKPYKSML